MKDIFEAYVDQKLKSSYLGYTDLNAGDVHRAVGGYPSNNHRMPVCCNVMRSRMIEDDYILCCPPKGNGASLTIRYYKKNHK